MSTHATIVIRDLPGGRVSVKVTLAPRLLGDSAAHSAAMQLLGHIATITKPTDSPTAATGQQPT